MKVEAGFKHILFTFVLFVRARSIIDQWKSRRKRETFGWETRFSFSRRIRSFSIFDGRFRYDGRRKKKKKKMARDDELSGTRLDAIVLPPPSPFLGKPKRFLFHPPRIATTTLARERPSSPSVHPFLSSPLPALRRFRPSLLTAALFPIWLLDYLGVRRERAGTYDAIGYRISAGSLIGRSTAHGRSRSAPSYD